MFHEVNFGGKTRRKTDSLTKCLLVKNQGEVQILPY